MTDENKKVRVRFAPSPTGRLHVGGARTAIYNWAFARAMGGDFILRIEDTDPERSTEENVQVILNAMKWLGLDWDEGPEVGGAAGPYFQTQRTDTYAAALEQMKQRGSVYPCFCTRADLHAASAPHRGEKPVYPGTCRHLSDGERAARAQQRMPAQRLIVPDREVAFVDQVQGSYAQNLAADCGDFLVQRSDGAFAYQLAVVVDDAAQGVTSVVRGVDLLCSTPQQLYLQELLGLPHPAYAHIPLLVAERDRRLSKRDRDAALDALLARFKTPEAVIGHIAGITGLAPACDPATPEELLATFDLAALPTTFDDLVQVRWR